MKIADFFVSNFNVELEHAATGKDEIFGKIASRASRADQEYVWKEGNVQMKFHTIIRVRDKRIVNYNRRIQS